MIGKYLWTWGQAKHDQDQQKNYTLIKPLSLKLQGKYFVPQASPVAKRATYLPPLRGTLDLTHWAVVSVPTVVHHRRILRLSADRAVPNR